MRAVFKGAWPGFAPFLKSDREIENPGAVIVAS